MKTDSALHVRRERENYFIRRLRNIKNQNSWEYEQSLPQHHRHPVQKNQPHQKTSTVPSNNVFTSSLTDPNKKETSIHLPPDSCIITQSKLQELLHTLSLSSGENQAIPSEDENRHGSIKSSEAILASSSDDETKLVKSPVDEGIKRENVLSQNTISTMSLLDQKRLQWAKEKAQMETEWNPWGRPGCGAPLMIGSGTRKPSVEWGSSTTTTLSSPHSSKLIGVTDSTRLLPPLGLTYTKSTSDVFPPSGVLLNSKEDQNVNQIAEKQIDENRNNRVKVWSTSDERTLGSVLPIVTQTATSAVANLDTGITRSFLRGANVPMDPETLAELELKRKKQREQQLAIQAQLEEKQRRIQREKEEMRREELREEEHLARLEAQQRLMEENLKREAMEKQLEEEKSRKEHQIQADKENVESVENVRQEKQLVNDEFQVPWEWNDKSEAKVDFPPEKQAPKSAPKSQPIIAKLTETSVASSPYVKNRVLTPTKYRGTQTSPVLPPRECGTQTDSSLSRKKDVGIDTENVLSSRKTKYERRKQERNFDGQEQHRPKWGAHHSEKSYQKQSEKESSRRRFQEMRQKRLEEEAMIQCGQPQVGNGGKRRSSARHQRQLLMRETGTPLSLTSNHRSASPRMGLSHQSSTETADDSNAEGSIRRPRRQWESPRTDEIPNFYTQPLNLAGRRNSRSQSSQSTDNNDARTPVKGNHDIYPQASNAPKMSSWNSAVDLHSHSEPILKTRMRSLENVRLSNERRESEENQSHEMRRDNWVNPENRFSAGNVDFIPYSRSSVSLNNTYTLTTRSAPQQQNKILQQLSTIRQGLLMKQQQIEHYLSKRNNFLPGQESDTSPA